MKKLRKEDSDQTGSGRANEAYCKKYKEASDNYLEVINTKMKDMYLDALQLKKRNHQRIRQLCTLQHVAGTVPGSQTGIPDRMVKDYEERFGNSNIWLVFPIYFDH